MVVFLSIGRSWKIGILNSLVYFDDDVNFQRKVLLIKLVKNWSKMTRTLLSLFDLRPHVYLSIFSFVQPANTKSKRFIWFRIDIPFRSASLLMTTRLFLTILAFVNWEKVQFFGSFPGSLKRSEYFQVEFYIVVGESYIYCDSCVDHKFINLG